MKSHILLVALISTSLNLGCQDSSTSYEATSINQTRDANLMGSPTKRDEVDSSTGGSLVNDSNETVGGAQGGMDEVDESLGGLEGDLLEGVQGGTVESEGGFQGGMGLTEGGVQGGVSESDEMTGGVQGGEESGGINEEEGGVQGGINEGGIQGGEDELTGGVQGGIDEGGALGGENELEGGVQGGMQEEPEEPEEPFVPTVSFDQVQNVFNYECAGCHGAPSFFGPSANLSLAQGYAYEAIVNVPSNQLSSMFLIEPYSLDNSYLWRKMTNTHREVGGVGGGMAPGFLGGWNSVSQNDLDLIATWILEGALQ